MKRILSVLILTLAGCASSAPVQSIVPAHRTSHHCTSNFECATGEYCVIWQVRTYATDGHEVSGNITDGVCVRPNQ